MRAWEIRTALHSQPDEPRFEYEDGKVIDRNPPKPGEGHVLTLEPGTIRVQGLPVTFHVTRRSYPAPPSDFVLSPDVTVLWARYQRFREGQEPLSGMAFFCLTVLEQASGGGNKKRQKAALKFGVHEDVLAKLGALTSAVGNAVTARKAEAIGRAHTEQELRWIEAVVRMVIRRVGEVAADPQRQVPQITMADLPKL